MKVLVLAAVAAAFVVPAASSARSSEDTIIVGAAAPTVADWSSTVSAQLNRNLRAIAAAPLQHTVIPPGMVSLRFHCSDEGKPTDIAFSHRSDNAGLNAIARRTVSRLRNMHPLPAGVAEGQVFEATILVASDGREYNRQLALLRQRQQDVRGQAEVLALVTAFNPSTRAE